MTAFNHTKTWRRTALGLCIAVLACGTAQAGGGGNSGGGNGGGTSGGACSTIVKDTVVAKSTLDASGQSRMRIRSSVTTKPCGPGIYTGWVTVTNLDSGAVEYSGSMWFRLQYSINLDDDNAQFNTPYRVDFTTYDPAGNALETRTTLLTTPAS